MLTKFSDQLIFVFLRISQGKALMLCIILGNETNLVGSETFLGTETLFTRRKIKLCEDE